MMQLKNIIKDTDDAARELIKNWYQDGSLSFWRASSNFIYQHSCGDEKSYLRFVHKDDKTIEQIAAELDFLKFLKRNGYPCACPVESINGRHIERVDTVEGRYFGVLFTEARGRMLEIENLSHEQFAGWGKSLGHLHHLSMEYETEGQHRESWKDKLNYIEKILARHPLEKSALNELTRIGEKLSSMPLSSTNFGLIHYDFESDNVYLDENTNTFNVIDFDDCVYHWFVMDIVCALKDFDGNDESSQNARDYFMKGYKSVMNIDQDIFKLVNWFERYDNLYTFSRLLNALEDSDIENAPKWMWDIKIKLINKCNFLRTGFTKSW